MTTWRLEKVAHVARGGVDRVQVEVAGDRVAFASPDVGLVPSVEAFAGLFLLPAMKHRATLAIGPPLDGTWLLGTRTLAGIYAERWGYPAAYPVAAARVQRDEAPPAPGHGLFFTGGVEGFYALQTAASRYDHLVTVQGYDIPLEDATRTEAWERSFRQVAREAGKRAVVLRTDLRRHRAFAAVAWERTHGAALAAAGHVLAGRIGTLSVPPGTRAVCAALAANVAETDELWSAHRLRIRSGEAHRAHHEPILRIARNALAWRHLRVCWENRAPTGNCSRCEACLRTMATLAVAGTLARFETFEAAVDLPQAIDALPRLVPAATLPWAELLALDLGAPTKAAVERLLARSAPRWWARWLAR